MDAYLYMLQLEAAAVPFSATRQEKLLSSGPLSSRNDAAVRYRLRNISFVLQERGERILTAYSAAPQVGKNVKTRIHKLLDERESTLQSIQWAEGRASERVTDLGTVLDELSQLRSMIASLMPEQQAIAGIGHNNPPEEIKIDLGDFSKALDAVSSMERSISSGDRDARAVESETGVLISLGMKLAIWTGQRITDFAKAGAVAAGTSAGLSMSGLGGKIIETLQQVFSHLF